MNLLIVLAGDYMKKVNTFKSTKINNEDSFIVKNTSYQYLLTQQNDLKDNLILLYIYVLPNMPTHGYKVGMTKVKRGETFWHAIKSRIDAQVNEVALHSSDLFDDRYEKYGLDREVVFWGISVDDQDDNFKDHAIHDEIADNLPGYTEKNQEWFTGSIVLEDIIELFHDYRNTSTKKLIYTPRNEQKDAIKALKDYFGSNPVIPRFLLNCKMRFGKCYTTYKYAEEVNHKKILILTFVPAVEDSWREDLNHIEKEYDYITDTELKKEKFKLENEIGRAHV